MVAELIGKRDDPRALLVVNLTDSAKKRVPFHESIPYIAREENKEQDPASNVR